MEPEYAPDAATGHTGRVPEGVDVTADEVISRVLANASTIAVVGASATPSRPSHGVAKYLRHNGFTVFAVNPTVDSLIGQPAYPTLADVPVAVDVVDVFSRPEYAVEVAEQAVAIGARALWLQLGVVNRDAARIADTAGLDVVMDRCIAIEHRRLRRRS